MNVKKVQYIILIIGLFGSIASIISLFLTPSIFPGLVPYKNVIISSVLLLIPFLLVIQLLKDKYIYHCYIKLRNWVIKKFYIEKVKYNDFRSKVSIDGTILGHSDESMRNAFYNSKIYITLKPRGIINSVQLALISKLKEITSYGITAEIFLNDYGIDEKYVDYYVQVLKKFLHKKPFVIYRISKMEDGDFSRIFKIRFEKGTKDIKICWLLSQSAELLKSSFYDDGKLKLNVFVDENTNPDYSILFNKREVYTSDILYPIIEIINMQILTDKAGDNPQHFFVLSGDNMSGFWNETKEQLGHNFTTLLLPLIKNLTNEDNAKTGDDENCVSLTKEKTNKLLSSISNFDSILEHYKYILFKNLDIITSGEKNEKVLYFSNNTFFLSYEELENHVKTSFNNDLTKKNDFLLSNFKCHLNKFIDYVD